MCKAFYALVDTIVIETESWPSELMQFSLFSKTYLDRELFLRNI